MRKIINLFLSISFFYFTHSQNIQPVQQKLKVFIDCSNTWCDLTFIKTEINIVDYLLDYQAADLHVLITEQNTGGGGSQYQMIFFGKNTMKSQTDTLQFNTNANATAFEKRETFIKYLKLGLTPFIARTVSAENISINMKQTGSIEVKKPELQTKDPWNYWVFRVSANGNMNADAIYKSLRYSGSFSLNRTTEALKVNFSMYRSKDKTTYEYETAAGREKFTVNNVNYKIDHYLVKSLTDHWSLGYEASMNSSTFNNIRRSYFFRTGAEYNIFPYKDVNSKYFTIGYTADVRHNKYFDTTLYNKTDETLVGQGIEMSLSLNQKWGTASMGANFHNYFHDWNFYYLGLHTSLSIRITGGLSFNIYTSGNLIRDQLYLPKGEATEQEVLTRRRQLESGYSYFTSFGLSYRFGSRLSNFVNPRFEGSNNGMMIFY
jgi:hypothetical protein